MSKITIGKKVFDDLYIHISAAAHIEHEERRASLQHVLGHPPTRDGVTPNVAKLNLKNGRISLLAYSDFENDPFPQLLASWSFTAGLNAPPIYRTYESSLNPPILHRKELLVPETHPEREVWAQITQTAEALGLFDDARTIGFRLNWDRLIESKGYRIVEGQFQPLGNETKPDDSEREARAGSVQRHLTALTRTNLSAPVQLLIRHSLLDTNLTFFDYGCGRGGDVAALSSNGFDARGWDPHFAPEQSIQEADAVNLGFVVNVIEDPAERVEAMHKAFALARRVMSVSVMLYGGDLPGKPYRDGFITSRNTFQKYFSQGEFKDYVEQVLHQEAFMVAPGVAFVFADKDLEQRFNVGRYRSTSLASRLMLTRLPRQHFAGHLRERPQRVTRRSRAELLLETAKPLLDSLWATSLELGRYPDPEEVESKDVIEADLGSVGKALRIIIDHYDQTLLAVAAQTRTDDLRLFFAMQQFGKRPPYRSLETRIQRDVKEFFGDYRSAQVSGLRLLTEAAATEFMRAACVRASEMGVGHLEEDRSLQLHLSLVERLPIVLRAYVACGMVLYNSVSDFQLVKIHIESGKLTLLKYDEFETSPLPTLSKRIKVNIRLQDYDVFDYASPQYPKPLLFWKSRYINEDIPGYAEQLLFDEELSAAELLTESGAEPAAEQFYQDLVHRRLAIDGFRLIRARSTPNLDDPCGANFTYRQLIECGATQKRLGIKNLPIQAESYNALYDLAVKILDPLIEYFGAVQLTYGFCSPELAKNINGKIAPKLDQHAAYEVGRGGNPVCDRGGGACDLLVEDENMREVADWIIETLPFDRLYFYGIARPIHISFGPQHSRAAYEMFQTESGAVVPRPLKT